MTSTQSPWGRLAALFSTAMLALLMAACGGSGAGAGGGSSDAIASTKAAQLGVISSETSLGSDGKKAAVITAIVKSELNIALANQGVTFSTNDSGVTLEVSETVTDDSGQISANLVVTDRTVRVIEIFAKAGTLPARSVKVPVVGTSLQINGSSKLVFDEKTEYSLSLRDSGGNPIVGASFTAASEAGNPIEMPKVDENDPANDNRVTETDSQGQAVFYVTGVSSGTDVITVRAQGVTKKFPAEISSTQLTYLTPAASKDVDVDLVEPVTVKLVKDGSAQAGGNIRFTVTRGGFVGADTAITNASGEATVQISSVNAGLATITATEIEGGASSGVTATRQIEFVSKTPAKIELQASPTVVGANLSPTGTNSSQLIAVVRDANDNPVKDARVDFSALSDPSNGRVEPAFGITDSFGNATTSFIAGPTATGFEAVRIKATVTDNQAIASTATLTVSELELSVRIGTGNELVEDGSLTSYRMPWTAIVADSAGNPVENAQVTAALLSVNYIKGFWRASGDSGWVVFTDDLLNTPTFCPSEDANLNARLDIGEDVNGNGELDPGAVATARAIASNSRTDENGLAEIEVIYPKTYGKWVKVRLQVTITTLSGTEASANSSFVLPVLAGDVQNTLISPPGATAPISPFGETSDCTTID